MTACLLGNYIVTSEGVHFRRPHVESVPPLLSKFFTRKRNKRTRRNGSTLNEKTKQKEKKKKKREKENDTLLRSLRVIDKPEKQLYPSQTRTFNTKKKN